MALRQPPILINPKNRAKPRQPSEPPYSALRHRYNFGLMYQDIWEPQLLSPLYAAKYNMEYDEAVGYIKTIMRDFVEQREDKNRDRIMENIGINRFKTDLSGDKFFVIDYHFLMNKFKLNRGTSPRKAFKINALINDVLLPSYKSVICIQDTLEIADNTIATLIMDAQGNNFEPVTSILDIVIDEDLIEEVADGDVSETFNEQWEDDESVYKIPSDISVTPLMVLEYYVAKLNNLIVKLHYYKISINKALIKSINKKLKSLNNTLKEVYSYDPKWIIEEIKRTQSLTMKKSKRSSQRRTKSI
jgi:hypothetical protein